jgi:hypothetical protein
MRISKWIRRPIVTTSLLEECEDDNHTPKMGTWESSGTLKTSEFDCRVQTFRIWVLFISLESYQNIDVENGLTWAIWTFATQVMAKRKVGNRPDLGVCRWNATHRWKALKESYKFSLDLIPIEGLSK